MKWIKSDDLDEMAHHEPLMRAGTSVQLSTIIDVPCILQTNLKGMKIEIPIN